MTFSEVTNSQQLHVYISFLACTYCQWDVASVFVLPFAGTPTFILH